MHFKFSVASIMSVPVQGHITDAEKRGGKKKKSKHRKRKASMNQSVHVNVRVGDSVALLPDRMRPPANRPNPGEFRRLEGPGKMYAELPQPLASGEYGIPPASVVPIFQGRPIVGEGNRPLQPAQPLPQTTISADKTPSRTLERGVNQNSMPLVRAPITSSQPFTGDVPRLPGIEMSPSVRASASQPAAGFLMTRVLPAALFSPIAISNSPIMRSVSESPSQSEPAANAAMGRNLARQLASVAIPERMQLPPGATRIPQPSRRMQDFVDSQQPQRAVFQARKNTPM